MRFRFDPLSRAFSNRCVFIEKAQIGNAQVISVNGKPKRIEMYAFSNENASVWTGPKTEKLPVLKNIWIRVDGVLEKMKSHPLLFHSS